MVCRDEKKETVLDCYVSGAQSETLLNLVNSSMLLLATNVGAEKVEESKVLMRHRCDAVEDTNLDGAVRGIGKRTKEVTGLGCLHLRLSLIEK